MLLKAGHHQLKVYRLHLSCFRLNDSRILYCRNHRSPQQDLLYPELNVLNVFEDLTGFAVKYLFSSALTILPVQELSSFQIHFSPKKSSVFLCNVIQVNRISTVILVPKNLYEFVVLNLEDIMN